MEIYQDPPAPAITPSRKVSFASVSTADSRRKPFAMHNHRGTPANGGKMRRAVERGSFKSPSFEAKRPGIEIQKNRTNKGTEKENMHTPSIATPSSASSYRRALRGASNTTPRSETARTGNGRISDSTANVKRGVLGRRLGGTLGNGLGPPQRVEPKTPNSLLRTELEDDNGLEESLLVSPPGALWNVLGAAATPADSVSSTGLVVVSPQAATTIHEIATSRHTKRSQATTSKPKSARVKRRPIVESSLVENNPTRSSPSEISDSIRHGGKGVAMDLSSMFANDQDTPGTGNEDSVGHPSLSETVAQIQPNQHGRGIAMDVSNLWRSNSVPESKGGPSPELLRRLQQPTKKARISATPKGPYKTRTKRAHQSPACSGNNITPKHPMKKHVVNKETPKKDIAVHKSGNGLAMDMSSVFSDSKKTPKLSSRQTPPQRLQRRLEHQSKPLSRRGKIAGKQDTNREQLVKANPTEVRTALAPRGQNDSARVNLVHTKVQRGTTKRVSKVIDLSNARPKDKADDEAYARPVVAQRPNRRIENQKVSTPRKVSTSDSMVQLRVPKSPPRPGRSAEDWAGKQCDTFVSWLNYTFNPTEDDEDTGDKSGLRALVLHRHLAQVRFRASQLFHSEEMKRMRDIVKAEISRGRLTIRSDRDLYADLSLRTEATQLLLSYTTPWLRLGLEVLFGGCILPDSQQSDAPQTSSVSQMRIALKRFVESNVLSDSNVLAKYTKGRTKIPSGKFERLYREEMRTLVLYRLLVLIFFLDHAKMSNALDKVPRLFTRKSSVKSSRAVLLSVCRNFLSSEGDFMKHLARIGLSVSYEQDPIDEIEFSIQNLATDLRDGGRLTRLTEITASMPFKSLMRSLRLPAVSRLQKMHNVKVALRELKEGGVPVPGDLCTHHIVDGHREMVLKLMWAVISHSCMANLLDANQVEAEINNVLRSNQARQKIHGRCVSGGSLESSNSSASGCSQEAVLKSLLFRWCQVVGDSFGLTISDLSDSFADGRALCYLVHYYHPSVIRLDEILPTTKYSCGSELGEQQLLQNERMNSSMAARRVMELGGIPRMVPVTDTNNAPSEKSMLVCLSYLCSRLMESSKEIFATILIQSCYRKYRGRLLQQKKRQAAMVLYKKWCQFKDRYYVSQQRRYKAAVATIEDFVVVHKHSLEKLKHARCQRLTQESAARQVQRYFRGLLGRMKASQLKERVKASATIQKYTRRFLAQKYTTELRIVSDAATEIQRRWRGFSQVLRFVVLHDSTVTLQRHFRGFVARNDLMKHQHAAMVIQAAWWGWVERAEANLAATVVQKMWRGRSSRNAVQEAVLRRESATTLQAGWRGFLQATTYSIQRECSISIQRLVRGFLTRRLVNVRTWKDSAVIVQRVWRSFSVQVQFQLDVLDIVLIQSLARFKIARRHFKIRLQAVAVLQRGIRCANARRAFRNRQTEVETMAVRDQAAVVCQCAVRMWKARADLIRREAARGAATVIQSLFRSFVCRNHFALERSAAVVIQSMQRGFAARRDQNRRYLCALKIQERWRSHAIWIYEQQSAAVIQRNWRALYYSKLHKQSLNSVLAIQRAWRGFVARNLYRNAYESTVRIQTAWRRFSAMLNYDLDVLEIIICQSVARRRLAQRLSTRRATATLLIQTAARRHGAMQIVEKLQKERCEYLKLVQSSIVVQSFFRGAIARVHFTKAVDSIIVIQSNWRAWLSRRDLDLMTVAATYVQKLFRGRRERGRTLVDHRKAAMIQSLWRCFSSSVRYSVFRSDVRVVQSAIRRFLAGRHLAKRKRAVSTLQSAIRRKKAYNTLKQLRVVRSEERLMNEKATVVQAFFRGMQVRHDLHIQHVQVSRIQAIFRRWNARRSYELDVWDIITVQSLIRRWLALRLTARRKDAVISAQRIVRAWIACRRMFLLKVESARTALENRAATVLQSTSRGFIVRIKLRERHRLASTIQAAFRGQYTRVWYCLCLMDVTTVQSLTRRWLDRRKYLAQNKSVLRIQKAARRWIALEHTATLREAQYLQQLHYDSSLLIQRIWRGTATRRQFLQHIAARKIQKTWRCFATHVDYLLQAMSVIIVQSTVRMFLARKSYATARHGMTRLQAVARGKAWRDHAHSEERMATLIQSWVRAFSQRNQFLGKRSSAITIQRITRGYFDRLDIALSHFAAVEIQRAWRGYSQFLDYEFVVVSAIRIQSFVRMAIAIKYQSKRRLQAWVEKSFIHHKVCCIQRAYRSHVRLQREVSAATILQEFLRTVVHRRRLQSLKRCVTKLQAAFRARSVRRRRTKRLTSVARRVVTANVRARQDPKLRLGYKTRHALHVLQTSRSLAEIMDAVKSLETSTRLSRICCVLFTEVNAARILLDLIRSCNRSVPHVELVNCILLTLDNVAQHRSLVSSFADCQSAEIFLDKMQMFRDKDGIFYLSVSLLSRVSECNPMVEEFCAMHEHVKRLKALHQLSLRRAPHQAPHTVSRAPRGTQNRMRKREHFDRRQAIKSLGTMVKRFEVSLGSTSPAAPVPGRQHFKF